MKAYRAQLDADRAKRLSKGTNHTALRVKADDMKSKVRPPSIASMHAKPATLHLSCCLLGQMLQSSVCKRRLR